MGESNESPNTEKKSSKLKITIIILAVLLLLSAGGLAARIIYLNFFVPTQSTVTVPDNLIGDKENSADESKPDSPSTSAPTDESHTADSTSQPAASPAEDKPHKAAKLELFQGHAGDNEKFEVSNMFPGDSVTKYFCVKVYHDEDVALFFRTDVTEQTKALGDVLHIKVTQMESEKVICDAPFAEVNGKEFSELLKKNTDEESTAYYRVDVSLDTSVGNEYQAAMLKADFNWYVKDEGGLVPSPPTGDNTNIVLWIALAASSLLMIFLLLLKRRKEDEQNEAAE